MAVRFKELQNAQAYAAAAWANIQMGNTSEASEKYAKAEAAFEDAKQALTGESSPADQARVDALRIELNFIKSRLPRTGSAKAG